jgi:DMSO reductase family type II enzyme heme b subunit
MKSVFALVAGALLLPAWGAAADAGLEGLREAGRLSAVTARPAWREVETIDWSNVPAVELRLHPQRSVAPGQDASAAIRGRLRAVSDGKRLALRVDWPDLGADRYSTSHTDRFADALAIQFVVDHGDTLPYIGMGEPDRPVRLWFWRAGRDPETLEARGFGTLEATGATPPRVAAQRTGDGWSVVLSGLLPTAANPLPVALAVWDGAEGGRDGRKHLSAWHLLHLTERAVDRTRLKALAEESRYSGGDPERGGRLAREQACTACHRLPGHAAPLAEAGPDLTGAGALHWPGYLRRAIADPSAFIVPGKAYAAVDQGGRRASLMPALSLTSQQIEDLAAFLSQGR